MTIKALEQEPCADIAQERYKDLCEYFGDAKDILKSREDFTAWLGRVKWHIRKAEELYEKYEYKQEPCENAISRQAVISTIYDNKSDFKNDFAQGFFADRIRDLQPVNPQPKTGHWILADEQNKEDVENNNYRYICSKCQCSDIHAKGTIVPYCWKCGRRMVESQESEGEE